MWVYFFGLCFYEFVVLVIIVFVEVYVGEFFVMVFVDVVLVWVWVFECCLWFESVVEGGYVSVFLVMCAFRRVFVGWLLV